LVRREQLLHYEQTARPAVYAEETPIQGKVSPVEFADEMSTQRKAS
jgi:hypothetical protein